MAAGILEAAIASDAEVLWRWLAVNGSFILFAIYLASTACLVALALQTRSLSRRVAALARTSEQRALLIDELRNAIDAFAISNAERMADERQVENSSQMSEIRSPTTIEAGKIRDELKELIVEMESERRRGLPDFRTK